MYEPYAYNSRFNKGKYVYPGLAPIGDSDHPPTLKWGKDQLRQYLKPVPAWQKKYGIASNRILVGEMGVLRTNKGAEQYLEDVIGLLNENNWSWAFYSFR